MKKLTFVLFLIFSIICHIQKGYSLPDSQQKTDTLFFVDKNPTYQTLKTGYSITKIEYRSDEIILYIKYINQDESIVTFFGSMTSNTWFIANSYNTKKTYPLKQLSNITHNGKEVQKTLGKGESAYFDARKGDVFTCKAHYQRLPSTVKSLDITAGMLRRADNIIFKNIKIKTEHGKKETVQENVVVNETTQNNQKNEKPTDELLKSYADSIKTYKNEGKKEKLYSLYDKTAYIHLNNKNYNEAINNYEKSLEIAKETGNKKQQTESLENIGNSYFFKNNYDKSANYLKAALKISQDKEQTARIQGNIATVYDSWFKYEEAIEYYNKAKETSQKLNDEKTIANINYKIGNIYYEWNDYEKSIEYYKKSLEIDEKIGNKKEAVSSMINLGVAHYQAENYNEAMQIYEKSLQVSQQQGDKNSTAIIYGNIGNVNYDKKQYNEAIDNYNKSITIKKEINNSTGLAISYHNIGNAYRELNDIPKAIEYYQKSNEIAQEINHTQVIYSNYEALSKMSALKNNCNETYDYYKKFVELRFQVFDDNRKQLSERKVKYIFKPKQKERFLIAEIANLNRTNEIKTKELNKAIFENKVTKMISDFIKEQKEKEIAMQKLEIAKKDEEMKNQKLLTNVFLIGSIVILIFLIISYIQFRQKKKANIALAFKNEEISQQKEEIEAQRDEIENQKNFVEKQKDEIQEKNKQITDSIHYASRIQNAILPPPTIIKNILAEENYFILFKPRDIVSGDFYWINQKDNKIIAIAADCTGHGVPGAFMSMLGVALLNEIMSKIEQLSSNEILDMLKQMVINSLHQTGKEGEAKDGMDLALSIIDTKEQTIDFAGAHNPLYLVRKNTKEEDLIVEAQPPMPKQKSRIKDGDYELVQFNADKMPIGISFRKNVHFISTKIKAQKDDTIYMLSDGYIDQFGGKRGRKFMSKRFKQLLVKIQDMPMKEQQNFLNETIEKWRGNYEQVDDIIVMGIKI